MQPRAAFVVALYEPCTRTACEALGRYVEAAGMRATLHLPDPAPASTLRHGVLPYGSFSLALSNGRTPTAHAAEAAVQDACRKLKTRFGTAMLDFNGTLLGSLG